ncbi:prephenate dehydrogenase/arogenate dehydrogenase family protein [Wenzhouxiangella sp. AB-CW3]|uniref:prephenate dehydrogenase/arogenate dehydrogenase family protein n=1 Tax=Wenzhouxiangella sp. AB-CW3 TaxID=2771012 RepID=UPI00168C07E7|nr:prephenate dehydrogenase/arogenate dehydrogenase family protein [Wenzhouxiangella sp. AB-CW3]QOC21409.1 prephenate dehydrogenase/arogenate dehydrogenase family protein [Wenzhouxiangella sp. AB-CW3]
MTEDTPAGLRELRDQLDEVDARLVELAARRQQLVSEIGRFKQGRGQQLRDFRRERQVLELVRARARSVDLDPTLAESLFRRLIDASLTRQEQERVRFAGRGDGHSALVIGGAGRMGRWLASFLDNQGYEVLLADPALNDGHEKHFSDWREAPLNVSLIVVAAPLRQTPAIIDELAQRRVPGLVFEVGSIKTPLIDSLRSAARSGLAVCAVHPMFGPDTRLLSGRHVLVMDVGCPAAVNEVTALFSDTMAEMVDIPLEQHDQLIALVLGLSHALNIAFFTALVRSGIEAGQLAGISSTTFRRQLEIARDVAGENPALYYEIQNLNEHGHIARDALLEAIESIREAADSPDDTAMHELMIQGRRYLESL